MVPGGASRSYGIQVARLAGLPGEVISRAREILKNLESGELNSSGVPRISVQAQRREARQLSLLKGRDDVRERLQGLEIERLTPIDALLELKNLKDMLEN